jgi:hypothetical protein
MHFMPLATRRSTSHGAENFSSKGETKITSQKTNSQGNAEPKEGD